MGQVSFKFENLKVWQLAMDLGEEFYTLSQSFPKAEIYNLNYYQLVIL